MAIWNAPVKVRNPYLRACTAALKGLERLNELSADFEQRGLPALRCRIGIHGGSALIGNFGASTRLNYTALGDNVNLAARLEPLCKYYGVDCIISGVMYHKVKPSIW
jgi:adenylate cyclase